MTPQERIGLAVLQAISEWTSRQNRGVRPTALVVLPDWGSFIIEIVPSQLMAEMALRRENKNAKRARENKCKS